MQVKPSQTKAQHYVPRMLLKHFSTDKKRIDVFILKKMKLINGVSIKNQCYENYFYGEDGRIEKALADLEGVTAPILAKIANREFSDFSQEELTNFLFFMHYQHQRTVKAVEVFNEFTNATVKNIVSILPKPDSLKGIDLDRYQIVYDNPQMMNLYHASSTIPILWDLGLKFIVNNHVTEFVISDNPVVLYNQFLEQHPKFGNQDGITGLALKGLQIFLPISPRVCALFYDPQVYKIGAADKVSVGLSKKDVSNLNLLQMMNASKCVYARSFSEVKEIQNQARVVEKSRNGRVPKVRNIPGRDLGDGLKTVYSLISTPSLKIGARFSFASVIDKSKFDRHDRIVPPVRSEELIEISKKYADFLDREVDQKVDGLKVCPTSPQSQNQVPTSTSGDKK